MIIKPIRKGKELEWEGKVYLEKAGKNKATFDVDGHITTMSYGKGYLETTCDCDYYGKKGVVRGGFCKHMIACILYCARKKGNVKVLK